LQEANQADKSDIEVEKNLSHAFMMSGKYNEAEDTLIDMLTLAPGRAAAWVDLGLVYAKKGNSGAAVASFANGYRFSDNRQKTIEYLNGLVEKATDNSVREAAKRALGVTSTIP